MTADTIGAIGTVAALIIIPAVTTAIVRIITALADVKAAMLSAQVEREKTAAHIVTIGSNVNGNLSELKDQIADLHAFNRQLLDEKRVDKLENGHPVDVKIANQVSDPAKVTNIEPTLPQKP